MATLLSRIAGFFSRKTSQSALPVGDVVRSDVNTTVNLEKMQNDRERVAIIKTCRAMYKGDPRVEKMHRVMARDLVRGGFIVKTNHSQAKQSALDLQLRLGLNQVCEDYTRLSARDGDTFSEISIDTNLLIQKLSRKPILRMHRNSDNADQFATPERAFWMDNSPNYGFSVEPPADATWFAEWQMLHLRWNHDEENRYGTPMMSAATGAFKRVQEGELDVAVRRKTRSGVRYHHVVEGSAADVEAYKEINKAALNNPMAATADFFSNCKGGIEIIQGEGTALGAIEDIEHHIETMATASDVPLGLIGYGSGLNRDILGDQKEQYTETLEQGREWLSAQFLKPLFERQWLLQGILPESVTYEIVWRPRVTLTPVLIRDLADALLKLKLLQVSDTDISAILTYFLPGVELDAATIAAAGSGDSERLAGMLKGLSI